MLKSLVISIILSITFVTSTTAQTHWDTASGYWNIQSQEELYIPVVVHIVYQYGPEYVPDTAIFGLIESLNADYNKRNADTATIIQPFKQYAANAKITFALAGKDPSGQATTGIVRHFSHLYRSFYGRLEQWPPEKYLNIWISGNSTIYSYNYLLPTVAMANPYIDGIAANYIFLYGQHPFTQQTGHYLNLFHVHGTALSCLGPCGDDSVHDTPPTKGHFNGSCPGSVCALDDTVCSTGYN